MSSKNKLGCWNGNNNETSMSEWDERQKCIQKREKYIRGYDIMNS